MTHQLRRKCAITDIDTVIRLYYQYPELRNQQINELFGRKLSSCTIARYKKVVQDEARERGIYTSMPSAVNTKLAYEVWGIDVADLKKRREKLKKLGFATA